MATIIDNVELDETNAEFNYASDFIKHTDRLVYLTGKAGTGKTTFLKYLRATTTKNTVILAPTGVAAINAGGQTIHSFFQLPFGPFVLNDKRLRTSKDFGDLDDTTIYTTFKYRDEKKTIIEELELLVIDEISMVRSDTLDVIDRVLRVFRKKTSLPFGGVQVILIGDTFQLPPIADFEQWEILKDYYASPFFFNSKVVTENKPIYIELKKIYRQKEQEFIDLLNKIRVNQITDIELNGLNAKYNPTFSSNGIDNHIILSTTNAKVNQTNSTKLDELATELKKFSGEVTGIFPKDSKGSYVLPTEENLNLKEGAQIMILKNDAGEFKRYFNGKIGKIASLTDSKIIVEFSDLTKVQIEKASWNNIQYTWNKEKRKIEEKVIGTFTQYPLRLAWSITVHKSQGLTFERVYADLGSAFEDGQVYVALSRCTTLSGLVLKTQIPRSKIRTNLKVIEFAKTETPSTLIVAELNSGKADFYYKKSRDALKLFDVAEGYNNILNALKFRNDIETDNFKRYLVAFSNRLKSHRALSKSLAISLEEVKNGNELLHRDNSNLQIKAKEQEEKISEQNRGLKLSINKIKDLEKRTEEIESELNEIRETIEKKTKECNALNEKIKLSNNLNTELHLKLEVEKSERNKDIKDSNNLLKIADYTIKNYKEDGNIKDAEICRLRNIKWYEKLIGRS